MTDNWAMVCTGVFLIIAGFVITNVRGAMPGAKRGGYPPPLRFRLILIGFGALMLILGAARLIHA